MKKDQDQFEVLRKIEKVKKSSQRELAEELGFSLGKIKLLFKISSEKRFVKIKKFSKTT